VCFGAGRRDVDDEVGIRFRDPVDVLAEFMLKHDVADKTELYDLRCISGVVREDDGVPEVLLGIIEGDFDSALSTWLFIDTGGGGGGVETWPRLTDCGIVDIRFILLVSVGLIVLAPSPVACDEW
jgi:hypothetical protein